MRGRWRGGGRLSPDPWFGEGLSQWLVALRQASADPEFVAREHGRLRTSVASSSRGVAESSRLPPCHQMLRHDAPAPKRTTIGNRHVSPRINLQAFRLPASNTIRTATHGFPLLLESTDLTKFQTRECWPQGYGPSLSQLAKTFTVLPVIAVGDSHYCHFNVSVQKIDLVVTSWSRGEFPDVSQIFQMQLAIVLIDCGSKGFQVGTAQQQPRVSGIHMCHKANCLLSKISFQFHCSLRVQIG